MTIGQVAQLWRYPVKSLGVGRSSTRTSGPRGVLGDRLWAVRDLERDVTASARQLPVLLTATARYVGPVSADAGPGNVPEVEITFPDGTVVSSSDDGVHAKLSELAGRDVRLTALPPAEDTSLHKLTRAERSETMSPAFLRASFGVADAEKLPDLSMVRVSDLVNFTRYSTPPGMFVDLAPVHVMSQPAWRPSAQRSAVNWMYVDSGPMCYWRLMIQKTDCRNRTGPERGRAGRSDSRSDDADRSLRRTQPCETRIRG